MENTANLKKNRPLFEKLARLFFTVYMITLYTFVNKASTVGISRLVFILYAGFTMLFLLQRKRIHIGKNVLVAYITVTWMYATIFWAKNSFYASFTMGTIWQVFLLFFLTYNLFSEEEEAHEYLLKSIYIAGISLVAYSIKSYGLAQVIEIMTSANVRIGGKISQANTFGMMNAITIIVAFYYLFYRKRFKIFHIVVVSTAFLFAMASGSRKALIMMCIGVLFLIYKKYGIRKLYKILVITAILVIGFMAVMKLPMFELINHRIEKATEIISGEGDGDESAKVRLSMIIDGWNIFKDRLMIGYGANNYAIVSGYGVYSHNNFIEILVDFGLVGFILYYLVYVIAIKSLISSKSDASKALLSIFLARLVMEVALVTYYDKLHWILMAFFLINTKALKQPPEKNSDEYIKEIAEDFASKAPEVYEETRGDFDENQEDFTQTREGYTQSEDCFADCTE